MDSEQALTLMLTAVSAVACLVMTWKHMTRRRGDRRTVQGARHEQMPGGPVRDYQVSVVAADGRKGPVQEWVARWPEVRAWAERESARTGVREVWVVYDDPVRRVSTGWVWEKGRLQDKVAQGWWQSARRSRKADGDRG